jgi:hypothetical protein
MLITYIKGGTPAQIFLERGSAMTRDTFVIFWPKLASFIDWCKLENDTFGLNQAELINEIKIKCARFVDKMKIGCI